MIAITADVATFPVVAYHTTHPRSETIADATSTVDKMPP
jgi:hypothetical protein